MKIEEIEKLRYQALDKYRQKHIEYLTQAEIYEDFYNRINYNPIDRNGRPIIVHNKSVIEQGLSFRMSYSNYVEQYQGYDNEDVKVGATTQDMFQLAGTKTRFLKSGFYDIGGLQCIVLEMQDNICYRDRSVRGNSYTVVDAELLLGVMYQSVVQGVVIPKFSVVKVKYFEYFKINGKPGIKLNRLIITLPENQGEVEVENIKIKRIK